MTDSGSVSDLEIGNLLDERDEELTDLGNALVRGSSHKAEGALASLLVAIASDSPVIGILANTVVQRAFVSPANKRLMLEVAKYELGTDRKAFIRGIRHELELLIGQAIVQLVRNKHDISEEALEKLGGLPAELAEFRNDFCSGLPQGEVVFDDQLNFGAGGIGVRISCEAIHRIRVHPLNITGGVGTFPDHECDIGALRPQEGTPPSPTEGGRKSTPDMQSRHKPLQGSKRPNATLENMVQNGKDNAEYLVWYATTRKPNDPSDATKGYSAVRDKTTHYGSCRVFVPKSHKIGSTGSPWWKRLLTLSDDRLRLLGLKPTCATTHWEEIAQRFAGAERDAQHALVFVHGYNVSFEEAALRAAQIGFDLSIKGAMSFFSWASQGTLDGYPADEATIEVNEHALAEYLAEFAKNSGARLVHVIAHSMGNRGMLRAINRIAADAQRRSSIHFGQFILAAPDVDTDLFYQLCAAYRDMTTRTTLYVSSRDHAIEMSQWLHNFPRAGFMPPVTIAEGIDTVDVANVDLTTLGHGYVADARGVLADMHELIFNNTMPAQRFGLRESFADDGKRYWLIGA